ncbi:MAG: hypothetical protein SNJ82_08360 [Gemmataceae bacterium]
MATTKAPSAPPGTSDSSTSAIPFSELVAERWRRGLLMLLTTLIVARPLVRGESLGLVSDLADPGGLVWALGVLLGCGGWAAWRSFSGRSELALGRVEAALLVWLAVLFAVIPFTAYTRASVLGSLEMLGLVLLAFLTRQLVTEEREKHGLFAVLLSMAATLSVQGLYQSVWEMPSLRTAALKHAEGPRQAVARSFELQHLESLSEGERELLTRRVLGLQAHGSYQFPSSLAAVLALLVPMLLAAVRLCLLGGAQRWQASLALAAWLLASLALVATQAWLSVLAAVLGCGVALANGRWFGWVGGLVAAAGVAGILYLGGWLVPILSERVETWAVSMRLVREYGLLGVGPGQFPLFYTQFMRPGDGAPAIQGNSALVELIALGGLGSLLAFLTAIVFLVMAGRRWWRTCTPVQREQVTPPSRELPWEFYLGGMLGVLLGFVVRTSALAEQDVIGIAILAGIGSLAWFAAYAMLEQFPWSPGQRVMALSSGLFAMGLALLLGPGSEQPAVLAFFFVTLGLLLGHVEPQPMALLSQAGIATGLPPPLFFGGAFALLLLVVVPTCHTAIATRQARLAIFRYEAHLAKVPDQPPLSNPVEFVRDKIIEPLRQAEREERGVVRTNALLARWIAEEWLQVMGRVRSEEADRLQKLASDYAAHARSLCSLPAGEGKIRPIGSEGLYAEYTIRQLFARRLVALADQLEKKTKDPKMPAVQRDQVQREIALLRKKADMAIENAMGPLKELRKLDPMNPSLAYLEALTWDLVGSVAKRRDAAEQALKLNETVGEARRLSNVQIAQIEAWERGENVKEPLAPGVQPG